MRIKLVFIALTLFFSGHAAIAHEYKIGELQIKHPWTRATPKGATVGGGYMTIINRGAQPDRLVGGSAAAAGKFEIHHMVMNNGVMQMRPVADGLEIKPGETVELKPGSFHAMLLDLKAPLVEGQKVKGTLVFQRAGKVDVEYSVEPIGASSKGHSGH